ncbi:MAG: two-component regulator propeller domain-containing protein [Bacteroidota bacterium]
MIPQFIPGVGISRAHRSVPLYSFVSLVCFVVLLSFVDFAEAGGLDPQKSMTQYLLKSWQTEKHSIHGSIRTILQTRDGYLWIATKDGVFRYDGNQFTEFNKSNTPEIPNNNITSLVEDDSGTLWIGSGAGLVRKKDRRFRLFTARDGFTDENVVTLCKSNDGGLWIGTVKRVVKISNGAFTPVNLPNGMEAVVYSICEDRENTLWVGTAGFGLYRFDRNGPRIFRSAERQLTNIVKSILQTTDGSVWVGTQDGLFRYRGESVLSYTTRDGLSSNMISGMYEDSRKTLWIATGGGGLNRFENDKFSRFTTADGLTNNAVGGICEDREGSLWIGTADGLNQLRDSKFSVYGTREGLTNDAIWSVLEDRSGNLWVGAGGGGINKLWNKRFTSFGARDGMPADVVRALCEDRDGRIWIGTHGGGLRVFRNEVSTPPVQLPNQSVYSILQDSRGDFWFGTPAGLTEWNGKTTKTLKLGEDVRNNFVRTIIEGRDHVIWVGTGGGGIRRIKDRAISSITTAQGLSNNEVMCLFMDREGTLWIGTYNGGLNRLKDGVITSFTTQNGMHDDIIYNILEDDRGNLWMGCNNGKQHVKKSDLEDFAKGTITSYACVSYGKSDGLKGVECNGGSQPSAWRTKDGKLWFSTGNGLAMIDPNSIPINTFPPPVEIESVVADDVDAMLGGALEFKPGTDRLEFHYAGLSLISYDSPTFRYMLSGYDKSWIDAGYRRMASYNNLSPGKYTFQVMACNSDGVWDTSGASVTVRLRPYFYQTRTFIFFSAMFLILLTVTIYRQSIRSITRRNLELEARVAERTQETLKQKDELEQANRELSQILRELEKNSTMLEESKIKAEQASNAKSQFLANVSHELRTPLNSVIGFANVLLKNKDNHLQQQDLLFLERISENGRQLLTLIDQILDLSKVETGRVEIYTGPVSLSVLIHETLEQFEGRILSQEIRLTQQVPEPTGLLKTDFEKLKQILINLVANAVKFTEKGTIIVRVGVHPKTREPLRIDVIDTGIGIPADRQSLIFETFQQADESIARKFGGTGLGLAISRSLCDLLGFRLEVVSNLGKGSTFSVILHESTASPVYAVDNKTTASSDSAAPSMTTPAGTTDELALRKNREQFLNDLQPFSHGNWAHLSLNRIALFGRNLRHSLTPAQKDRFRDTVKTYLEKTVPALSLLTEGSWSNTVASDVILALGVHTKELTKLLTKQDFDSVVTPDRLDSLEHEIPKHVDDVLHAVRMMRDQLFAHFQCDIVESAQSALKEHERELLGNKVHVDTRLPQAGAFASISRGELTSVIGLMIRNALHAMSAQKERKLVISARLRLDRWLIEISDSGSGIPSERWQAVFEQANGASVAHEPQLSDIPPILQKYEGDICVKESSEKFGTTYLLRLKAAHV